jgi:hypothetical protein
MQAEIPGMVKSSSPRPDFHRFVKPEWPLARQSPRELREQRRTAHLRADPLLAAGFRCRLSGHTKLLSGW